MIKDGELYLTKTDTLRLDNAELRALNSFQGTALAKMELDKFLLSLSVEQRGQYAAIQNTLTACKKVEGVQVGKLKSLREVLGKKYDLDFSDPSVSYDDETGRLLQDGGAIFKE